LHILLLLAGEKPTADQDQVPTCSQNQLNIDLVSSASEDPDAFEQNELDELVLWINTLNI